MKIRCAILLLVGVWFLCSAATEGGLLPSGHGAGRVSEVAEGVAFIALALNFLVRRSRTRADEGSIRPNLP